MKKTKILFITPMTPFEIKSGGEQRSSLFLESLNLHGSVDVMIMQRTNKASYVETSSNHSQVIKAYWHKYPGGFRRFSIDHNLMTALDAANVDLSQYDMVIARYLGTICKLSIPKNVKTYVDLDDFEYVYDGIKGWLKSRVVNYLCSKLLNNYDGYFFVTQKQKSNYPNLKSTVVPNIPYHDIAEPLHVTEQKKILFVGAIWYPPNSNGLKHFIDNVWPKVRQIHNDAVFTIVGKCPEFLKESWENIPGVEVKGYVDNLVDEYKNCSFTVAPIYTGGGTNIKVLESMAFGRACICTTHSAIGFDTEAMTHGLAIANNDEEFATLCNSWLSKKDQVGVYGVQAFYNIKKNYNCAIFSESISKLLVLS